MEHSIDREKVIKGLEEILEKNRTGRSVKRMKYIVLKDRIGIRIFIPIDSKPIDCCGFVRWGRPVK